MRRSRLDRLEALFRAKPNQWVRQGDLMKITGSLLMLRIAECRTQRGMTIENRVRVVRSNKPLLDLQGSRTFKVSEYRYVPQTGLQSDAGGV